MAADVAGIGSSVSAANAAAAAPTTAALATADDEVSAAITAVFSSHARQFQALSAQAAAFHDQFVQILKSGAGSYASTEAANASPLLGQFDRFVANGFAIVEQEIQQTSGTLTATVTGVADTVIHGIFGMPAVPPFSATQSGTYTGTPSLVTRLEEAVLYPVKPFLAFPGSNSNERQNRHCIAFTGNDPVLGCLSATPATVVAVAAGRNGPAHNV